MDKEFGKLSRQQLRDLYAYHQLVNQNKDELKVLVRERKDRVRRLLAKTPPWANWYELPWTQNLALFLVVTGLNEVISETLEQLDPQQAVLDYIDSDIECPEGELSDEEHAWLTSLIMSIFGQITCMSIYSQSLSELVEKSKNGDDESLFNAVLVDCSAIATPSIARCIQLAHLVGDESFFQKLAKAVTKTRPRRPANEYDGLRYMIEVVDESIGLDHLSGDQLYDLFVDDLELYPNDNNRKDPYAGLMRVISRRK